MNKDHMKGTAKAIAGKIEKAAGRAAGSKEHQARRMGKQVLGKPRRKYGDAKEALKDAVNAF
jgi:uncharacterized protein YjbJ (UPF0337 family)